MDTLIESLLRQTNVLLLVIALMILGVGIILFMMISDIKREMKAQEILLLGKLSVIATGLESFGSDALKIFRIYERRNNDS